MKNIKYLISIILIPIILNQFIELEINKEQDKKNKSEQIQDEGGDEETSIIEITHIKFNHIGPTIKEEVVIENTTDSLYMRRSFKESLKHKNHNGQGEWIKSPKRNEPALYLINIKPIIKVRLKLNKLGLKSAKIKAIGINSKIPNVIEKTVTFNDKGISVGKDNTQYVEFQLDKPISKTISKTIGNFKWVISGNPENNEKDIDLEETGPHTFYTVLDRPKGPWNTKKTRQKPWETALEFAINKAGTKGLSKIDNTANKVTNFIYKNYDLLYNTSDGKAKFYINKTINGIQTLIFNFTEILNKQGKAIVNCDDVAFTISTTVSLLGIQAKYTDIKRFGYIKRGSLIGIKKEVNSTVDKKVSGLDTCIHKKQLPNIHCDDHFIYDLPPHQRFPFVRHAISEIGTKEQLIYDACIGTIKLEPHLKIIDRDTYLNLTQDTSTKEERDPANNPAGDKKTPTPPGTSKDFKQKTYEIE